jgi:hypothetical protein
MDAPMTSTAHPMTTSSAASAGHGSADNIRTARMPRFTDSAAWPACSAPDHAAPLRIIASISGVPTNAIATPVDKVESRSSASTALSVASTSAPPASAESGTSAASFDDFAPRIMRSRFGAISPTYDNGPAIATATLAKPTATVIAKRRVASTLTPAALAASSPSASGSSGRITKGNAASGSTSHASADINPDAPG